MLIRQPIRNTSSNKDTKPRVFDALIEDDEVYLEVKNTKQREIVRLTDVLRQIEEARRAASKN
jgi:hypothetical protein